MATATDNEAMLKLSAEVANPYDNLPESASRLRAKNGSLCEARVGGRQSDPSRP